MNDTQTTLLVAESDEPTTQVPVGQLAADGFCASAPRGSRRRACGSRPFTPTCSCWASSTARATQLELLQSIRAQGFDGVPIVLMSATARSSRSCARSRRLRRLPRPSPSATRCCGRGCGRCCAAPAAVSSGGCGSARSRSTRSSGARRWPSVRLTLSRMEFELLRRLATEPTARRDQADPAPGGVGLPARGQDAHGRRHACRLRRKLAARRGAAPGRQRARRRLPAERGAGRRGRRPGGRSRVERSRTAVRRSGRLRRRKRLGNQGGAQAAHRAAPHGSAGAAHAAAPGAVQPGLRGAAREGRAARRASLRRGGRSTRRTSCRARCGGCDDADCVVALCRRCHRSFDRGELDLLPHLEPAPARARPRARAHVPGAADRAGDRRALAARARYEGKEESDDGMAKPFGSRRACAGAALQGWRTCVKEVSDRSSCCGVAGAGWSGVTTAGASTRRMSRPPPACGH